MSLPTPPTPPLPTDPQSMWTEYIRQLREWRLHINSNMLDWQGADSSALQAAGLVNENSPWGWGMANFLLLLGFIGFVIGYIVYDKCVKSTQPDNEVAYQPDEERQLNVGGDTTGEEQGEMNGL